MHTPDLTWQIQVCLPPLSNTFSSWLVKSRQGGFGEGGGERAGRAIRASGSYREQGCQIAGVFMAASVTDNICRFVIPHPRTAAQHPPNIPQQRFSHLFSTAPKFCQVNMDVSWPWYSSVSCILDSYFLQELFLMLVLCPSEIDTIQQSSPNMFDYVGCKYVYIYSISLWIICS